MRSRTVAHLAIACVLCAATPAFFGLPEAGAADHDDTPLLKQVGRHNARITDLHAFVSRDRLVVSVATNATIPASLAHYLFPDDLTLRILIDNNSRVSFADPVAVAEFGGTVVQPSEIEEDVVLEITFPLGAPRLRTRGLPGRATRAVRLFAGLRDDPFIRGPPSRGA